MQSNRSLRAKKALVAIALAVAGGRSVVTRAATLDELQAQIDALRKQVVELQAKESRRAERRRHRIHLRRSRDRGWAARTPEPPAGVGRNTRSNRVREAPSRGPTELVAKRARGSGAGVDTRRRQCFTFRHAPSGALPTSHLTGRSSAYRALKRRPYVLADA
jgi:hypothetical protein